MANILVWIILVFFVRQQLQYICTYKDVITHMYVSVCMSVCSKLSNYIYLVMFTELHQIKFTKPHQTLSDTKISRFQKSKLQMKTKVKRLSNILKLLFKKSKLQHHLRNLNFILKLKNGRGYSLVQYMVFQKEVLIVFCSFFIEEILVFLFEVLVKKIETNGQWAARQSLFFFQFSFLMIIIVFLDG